MPLEDQRTAPARAPLPHCVEPGCDRPAAEGDERCELHRVRLGSRPSRPSQPPVPRPAGPAPAVLVVETALDAPPPAAPGRSARDQALALAGWAVGSAGFVVSTIGAMDLQLPRDLAAVHVLLTCACGVLACLGAAWFAAWTRSKALQLLGGLLFLASLLPTGLAALLSVLALINLFS